MHALNFFVLKKKKKKKKGGRGVDCHVDSLISLDFWSGVPAVWWCAKFEITGMSGLLEHDFTCHLMQ